MSDPVERLRISNTPASVHRLKSSVRNGVSSLGRIAFPSSLGKVTRALQYLAPIDSGMPLIRLGERGNGGYLVPDDLDGIGALFSPGVSETWTFERAAAEQFGIKSFMLDGSVEAPVGLTHLQEFKKQWLVPRTSAKGIDLSDWVDQSMHTDSSDLMLQMDIEGGEYAILAHADLNTLRRFRIIIVEFHGLDWLAVDPMLRLRIAPALRRLGESFRAVHVHPNNCCPLYSIHDIPVPRVLEVTYLRKDRFLDAPPKPAQLPHALDFDCVPEARSVELPTYWPFGPNVPNPNM